MWTRPSSPASYLLDGVLVAQGAVWSGAQVHVGGKFVALGLQARPVGDVEVEAPEDRWTVFCGKDKAV